MNKPRTEEYPFPPYMLEAFEKTGGGPVVPYVRNGIMELRKSSPKPGVRGELISTISAQERNALLAQSHGALGVFDSPFQESSNNSPSASEKAEPVAESQRALDED